MNPLKSRDEENQQKKTKDSLYHTQVQYLAPDFISNLKALQNVHVRRNENFVQTLVLPDVWNGCPNNFNIFLPRYLQIAFNTKVAVSRKPIIIRPNQTLKANFKQIEPNSKILDGSDFLLDQYLSWFDKFMFENAFSSVLSVMEI